MPKIDEIFAFVADDDEGEGIVGFLAPNGQWMPLVGADFKRVDSLRPIAKDIAQTSGKVVRLLRFSVREEREIIQP